MISGKQIFKLVTEQGLSLDIINIELREKGLHFDTCGFIAQAVVEGWTEKRTIQTLMANSINPNNKELSVKISSVYKELDK